MNTRKTAQGKKWLMQKAIFALSHVPEKHSNIVSRLCLDLSALFCQKAPILFFWKNIKL